MALNINGTTGISGVDGSASAPAVTGTDSNTGINFASDTVNINTGGSTRATVDSSGRFLIGTTTEGDGLADNLTIEDSSNCGLTIRGGTSSLSSIFFADGTGAAGYVGQQVYNHSDNSLKWIVNGSESMRITSGGALCVGATAPTVSDTVFHTQNNTGNGGTFYHGGTSDNYPLIVRNDRCNGGTVGRLIHFQIVSALSPGSITANGSGTSFNTTSDYRLKENIVSLSDGITRIKQLIPKRFNFITDETNTLRDGFLAHEVSSIIPEAITGEKDAVDSEGEIDPQSIDQSKLVPLLTAALQEAIAKIEVLETKVAALEAG